MARAAHASGVRRLGLLAALLPVALASCAGPKPTLIPEASSFAVRQLRTGLDELLAAPGLETGVWGVLVRSLASEETLYSVNARKLLMPASSLKVATLAVAAERLGWDFRYETRLLASGTIGKGVLDGDLVVVGGGDPSLNEADGSMSRVFASWADRLTALGVRVVTGRVIGDDNLFDDESLGSGWMWDDLAYGYSAGIGALQVNLNATRVSVTPGPAVGAPATATLGSEGSGLTLQNRVRTGETGSASQIVVHRPAGRAVIEVSGSTALGDAPSDRLIAVDNPTLNFVAELRKALVAHGIEVRGGAADIDELSEPPRTYDAVVVDMHRSPTLAALAVTLMKTSQNQYAETLLKTLGASTGTASSGGGRRVMREVLEAWGVRPSDLVLADGSGLSRYNLVTPEALVTTLTRVYQQDRLRGPFEAALPIAGRDGTLWDRLKGTPAEGNLRAKTGSMTGARSVSGYVSTADGEPLVCAIVANNYHVAPAMIDSVIDRIVARLAGFTRGR